MKSAEEIMEILEAYDLTGSLRDAAELAGCSHHTVASLVAARERGELTPGRAERRDMLVDPYREKLEEWVDRSRGKVRSETEETKRREHYTQARAAEDASDWTTAISHYSNIVGYCDAEARLQTSQRRQEVHELKSLLDAVTSLGVEDWRGIHDKITELTELDPAAGLCPSGGVNGFGRRFPRRPASLKEGTHVRVEEDIACAAVAGRD